MSDTKPLAQTATFSLQGWDTANATTFAVVNQAIVDQNKVPAAFAQAGSGGAAGVQVNGKWGTWQLVQGSSGGLLRMACTVAAGEAFAATAAPYLLDPATAGSLNLAQDGLTVTSNRAKLPSDLTLNAAFGTVGRRTGKFYFEVFLANATAQGVSDNRAMAGLAHASAPKDDFGTTADSWSYQQDGTFHTAGKTSGTATPATAWITLAETVGVAVDLDSGKLWFRATDGSWIGTNADPAKGTGEAFVIDTSKPVFPAVAVGLNTRVIPIFGFATAFKHPVPAGFAPWQSGKAFSLDKVVAQTEITLTQVAAAGSSNNLMANATGTALTPAVTIKSLQNAVGSQMEVEAQRVVLEDWFNAQIAAFDNIFHTVDIDDGIAKAGDKFQWLKPTSYDYAVADIPASTPPASVFSILAMTESRSATKLAREIDPTIMASLPAGANSVVVLSAERFAAKILLGAVADIFPGSKPTDFTLAGNGLVVTNVNAVDWHAITLADKSKVTPKAPAGGFKLRVDGHKIALEFTAMEFDYPGWTLPGTEKVKIDLTQELFLTFDKRQKDGKHVLSVSNRDPNDPNSTDLPKLTRLDVTTQLDATATKAQQDQQRLEQIAVILSACTLGLGVISAGLGCFIKAGSLCAGDVAAAAAADAGDVEMDGAAAQEVDPNHIYGSGPPPLDEYSPMPGAPALTDSAGDLTQAGQTFVHQQDDVVVEVIADNAGGQASQSAIRGATCLSIAKVAFIGSMATFVGGLVTSAALWGSAYGPGQAKIFAKGDFDNVNDDFTAEHLMDNLLAAYDWPKTANWELTDAALKDGALLLYGNLT